MLTQPETVEDTNSHMVSAIPQGLYIYIYISFYYLSLIIHVVDVCVPVYGNVIFCSMV